MREALCPLGRGVSAARVRVRISRSRALKPAWVLDWRYSRMLRYLPQRLPPVFVLLAAKAQVW